LRTINAYAVIGAAVRSGFVLLMHGCRIDILHQEVVNLGLVAWAEMDDQNNLTVHFCVPRATVVSGVTHSAASGPTAASDHYMERFTERRRSTSGTLC
jgi:hypothetical protein